MFFLSVYSESFFIGFLFLVLSQSSSLWASLFIVPLSVFLVFLVGNFFLSLVFYLYVMVFISGLLIFLVSVASLAVQDQSSFFVAYFLGFVVSLFFYFSFFEFGWFCCSQMSFVLWVESEGVVLFVLLVFLLGALVVMSTFFLSVKGFVRPI